MQTLFDFLGDILDFLPLPNFSLQTKTEKRIFYTILILLIIGLIVFFLYFF